jgi:hypothetical protein
MNRRAEGRGQEAEGEGMRVGGGKNLRWNANVHKCSQIMGAFTGLFPQDGVKIDVLTFNEMCSRMGCL